MTAVLTNLGTQTGQQSSSGNGSRAASPSVTSGNRLLVQIVAFASGGTTSAPTFSKTGTATIGSAVLDFGPIRLLSAGTQLGVYFYSIPITGSGTLTLTFTSSNTLVTWNYIEVSGLTGVVDVTGSNNAASGTSLSTGSVTPTTAGIAVGCFVDGGASNETYSAPSGTQIMNFGSVALLKGYSQYKIYASGAQNLSLTMSSSAEWQGSIVTYKAAAGFTPVARRIGNGSIGRVGSRQTT